MNSVPIIGPPGVKYIMVGSDSTISDNSARSQYGEPRAQISGVYIPGVYYAWSPKASRIIELTSPCKFSCFLAQLLPYLEQVLHRGAWHLSYGGDTEIKARFSFYRQNADCFVCFLGQKIFGPLNPRQPRQTKSKKKYYCGRQLQNQATHETASSRAVPFTAL